MFDFMTNAKITKVREGYYTVTGDTKRFGKNQIMYEGIKESECIDYIKKYNTSRIPDPLARNVQYEITRDSHGSYYITTISNGVRSKKQRMKRSDITELIRSKYNNV